MARNSAPRFLSVLLENHYDGSAYTALVRSFGREYAVSSNDEGGFTVHRTNATGYERLPRWKVEADVRAVEAFAESRFPR